MLIEWNGLTGDQRNAILQLHAGRHFAVPQEICEQLRNLGLAEWANSRAVLSGIGLSLMPAGSA
jgi:hypothetical protein